MHATLHRYRLPLSAPIELKGVRHEAREGLLLRLDDGVHTSFGDCAPLPGFSRESIDDAERQLDEIRPWLETLDPAVEWADLDHPFHEEVDRMALHPSVRFAVELALFDLIAMRAGRSLSRLLHPDPEVSLPTNALLPAGGDAAVLEAAADYVARGYETLKLKVGRRPLDEDLALVRALRVRLGPDVGLRLDANQAWSRNEATTFAEGILGLEIEYVEEPLREPEDLPVLWFDTGLPIAVDESLMNVDPENWSGGGFAAAAVLKPTLLGGIVPTLRMARAARSMGVKPVVSASFESGVAFRAHVALAAATGGAPAGLDPYNRLARDVLVERLDIGPLIDVPALLGRPVVVDSRFA